MATNISTLYNYLDQCDTLITKLNWYQHIQYAHITKQGHLKRVFMSWQITILTAYMCKESNNPGI